MTIRLLKDVPVEELTGKFICLPSKMLDLKYGYPARIEKASRNRLQCRRLQRECGRLQRGEGDDATVEWRIKPEVEVDDGYENAPVTCNLASIEFVCDEASEAIGLYAISLRANQDIHDYRKKTLAAVTAKAAANEVPIPEYLLAEARDHAPA